MEIKKLNLYIGLGMVVGLGAIIYVGREKIYQYFDYKTNMLLLTLDKDFRDKVAKMIRKAQKQGIELRVTSARRSCTEQERLYAQGRQQPGNIVTNARCGQSAHNYGRAVDVVEFRNGVPIWQNPNWEAIGQIGESLGLEWGGRWKSFVDKPHFQDLKGKTIAQLYHQYKHTGRLDV